MDTTTAGVKMIEQQVKDAIEEFGELAHERFFCNKPIFAKINRNDGLYFLINNGYKLELKTLPELFEHDVKFYGADAYLMWEWVCTNEITAIPAQSNKELDFKRKA